MCIIEKMTHVCVGNLGQRGSEKKMRGLRQALVKS